MNQVGGATKKRGKVAFSGMMRLSNAFGCFGSLRIDSRCKRRELKRYCTNEAMVSYVGRLVVRSLRSPIFWRLAAAQRMPMPSPSPLQVQVRAVGFSGLRCDVCYRWDVAFATRSSTLNRSFKCYTPRNLQTETLEQNAIHKSYSKCLRLGLNYRRTYRNGSAHLMMKPQTPANTVAANLQQRIQMRLT